MPPGSLIFVVGPRRSGTTLVNNILCADPAANRQIGEAQLLQRLLSSFAWGADNFDRMTRHYTPTREGLEELCAATCRQVLHSCWEAQGRPRHLVLKNPELSMHVGQLRRYFPDARFVVCVRDPRDQIASERDIAEREMRNKVAAGRHMAKEKRDPRPAIEAGRYAHYLKAVLRECEAAPNAFCFVRYEDLVRNPRQEAARIGAFCGLDLRAYDPSTDWQRMEITRDTLAERTTFSPLYGRPVSDARVGRFRDRLMPEEVAEIEKVTGKLMRRFGYAPAAVPSAGKARMAKASAMPDIEYVIVAEAGTLARQALLLLESIRLLPGGAGRAALTVISPRPDRRPSRATLRRLNRLSAEYLPLTIDSPCPVYGSSFKLGAMSAVEKRPGPPILVMIDSDTLFLAPPIFDLGERGVALRPEDVKGISTTGADDPFDGYWRRLCEICAVDYDEIPWTETSDRAHRIKANHNGGLVAANRRDGLFATTYEFLCRSVSAGITPGAKRAAGAAGFRIGSGLASPGAGEYWGAAQVVLSLALVSRKLEARLLPPTYNVPCHYFEKIVSRFPEVAGSTVHAHYHWLCDSDRAAFNPLLDGRMTVNDGVKELLRRYVPINKRPRLGRRIRNLIDDSLGSWRDRRDER